MNSMDIPRSSCFPPLFALVPAIAAACGSRTGLLVDDEQTSAPAGSSSSGGSASTPPFEAGVYDALPQIDASVPEAAPPRACADASATLVYVLTEENGLYTFDPPSLAFTPIGTLACKAGTATPFSMAVNRQGIAYSLFAFSGSLFRLNTANAVCDATPYVPNQQGFNVFGMGYVAMPKSTGERLYVADNEYGGALSKGLAWIDTDALTLNFVAPFSLPLTRGELTGTGDGRLFMFFGNVTGPGSHIAQVDPASATLLAQDDLKITAAGAAFAFAYWGGEFWIFTSQSGPSTVTRYTPSTHTEADVATAPGQIVGAGVSTCAPE